MKKITKLGMAAAVLFCVVGLGSHTQAAMAAEETTIENGISIGNVNVGGMTENQAISAVLNARRLKLRESYLNVQIGVSFLLQRENIEELIPAMSFWEKTGIDFFDIRNDILNYEKNEFITMDIIFSTSAFWLY